MDLVGVAARPVASGGRVAAEPERLLEGLQLRVQHDWGSAHGRGRFRQTVVRGGDVLRPG